MTMTARERVLCALNHEEPDRVPIVIGVSNATGIKMKTYRGIKELIGIDEPENYIYEWPELGSAEIDEATMQRLHSDVRGVRDLHPLRTLKRNREREAHSPFIDSWGSGQTELGPDDWCPSVHPTSDATTPEDIEAYAALHDMSDPSRLAHLRAQASKLAEVNEDAILATPWLFFTFQRAYAIESM